MTVYTVSDFVGGKYGLRYGRPSNVNYTSCVFALDCEGTNGQAYVTAAEPPGANDVAATTAGTLTLVDTWARTTSRFNLGTSSLAFPGTGTTAYLRTTTSVSTELRSGAFSAFIYLDALPAATADFFHWTSDTARPGNTPTYGWWISIGTDGTVSWDQRINSVTTTRASVATLTAGAWHFISVAWFFDAVFIGINGTVEAYEVARNTLQTQGTSSSLVATLKGGTNFGGIYVDDIRFDRMFDPRFAQNYTVPTQRLETYVPEASRATITAKTFGRDYITTSARARTSSSATVYRGYSPLFTSIQRYVKSSSPAIAYLLGINDTNGLISNGSGGGGSTRPGSGFLYPRGQG